MTEVNSENYPEEQSPRMVFERMIQALNRHDLEALVNCFAPDYQSYQPFYPERTFTGTAMIRQNWGNFFTSAPDIQADVLNMVVDSATVWAEMRFYGIATNATPFEMRGVSIQGIRSGQIAWARVYFETLQQPGS